MTCLTRLGSLIVSSLRFVDYNNPLDRVPVWDVPVVVFLSFNKNKKKKSIG